MSANLSNLSPNLFRLSLPEWLKEQVDSGKHKGVYWIDRKEKIFHVPWKHASRNGWEDGDVSLFKAWAIYTNRYREGVDKARPALWKTNFRCAINSHNSIAFIKDQGQRKGDKAHRIMKLIDPPRKTRKLLNGDTYEHEPPRKLVRLTYPNFGSSLTDASASGRGKVRNGDKQVKYKTIIKKEACDACSILKMQMQDVLNSSGNLPDIELNPDFLMMRTTFINLMTSKEHLCTNEHLKQMLKHSFVPPEESSPKPNLQDLYFIGKALQTADGQETLKVAIKVESEMEIVDTSYLQEHGLIQPTEIDILELKKEISATDNNSDSMKNSDEIVVEEEIEEEIIEEVLNEGEYVELIEEDEKEGEEDDELITPRNV